MSWIFGSGSSSSKKKKSGKGRKYFSDKNGNTFGTIMNVEIGGEMTAATPAAVAAAGAGAAGGERRRGGRAGGRGRGGGGGGEREEIRFAASGGCLVGAGSASTGKINGSSSHGVRTAREEGGGGGGGGGDSYNRQRGSCTWYGRGGRGESWSDVDAGVKVTEAMVLFWHQPACFAQWTPAEFEIDNVVYCNAEQWMMASKAKLFGDSEIFTKIMNTNDPREHKALGRQVRNFDADLWETAGQELVVKGNLAKFRQNEDFKYQLLATGDKILAEASPYDSVWGIGLTADDPRALVQRSWQGLNKLGDALMDVRRQLKEDMYNADTYNYRRSNVRENEEDGKNDDGGGMISFGEVNTIGNHR